MTESYETSGYFSEEELKQHVPPKELLKKKKAAIVECLQQIPCNACLDACKSEAVSKADINDPPKVDWGKCNSCLQCIRECPGLAMFVLSIKEGKAQISIPWEMPYVPKKDEVVDVLNRKGEKIGTGKIVRVIPPIKDNKTWIVTFETDEGLIMKARNFRRRTGA
jgi:Fe-S-cluster-containing hydrogenase component 2